MPGPGPPPAIVVPGLAVRACAQHLPGLLLVRGLEQGTAHLLVGELARDTGEGADVQELLRARNQQEDDQMGRAGVDALEVDAFLALGDGQAADDLIQALKAIDPNLDTSIQAVKADAEDVEQGVEEDEDVDDGETPQDEA